VAGQPRSDRATTGSGPFSSGNWSAATVTLSLFLVSFYLFKFVDKFTFAMVV
jgi:hypothetical protein